MVNRRRFSNGILGFLNLVSLLASIPIIGAGLWMARSNTTCESFLQTPLLVIGFVILVISLAGFIGACFDVACVLWLYLVVMLFIIIMLMALTIFGFIVTGKGGGVAVPGRNYKEYHIDTYSSWLRKKVKDPRNWYTIKSCIIGTRTCDKIVPWTPVDYQVRSMSPIQSGCCKPPTSCDYSGTVTTQDSDCYKWSNAPNMLCYECDSCKAGVMEDIRRSWHKLSMLNVVILVLLIVVYSIGCCAFQNIRSHEDDYWFSRYWNRRGKGWSRWDDNYWWRWWDDLKGILF